MTCDIDALVNEIISIFERRSSEIESPYQGHNYSTQEIRSQLLNAIARLTRERDEANALANWLRKRNCDTPEQADAWSEKCRLRAETAEAALSAARAELAEKEGWVRVPIEVENACLNWLANRIKGNSHGEDVELGRLMRGLQTYIKSVADGTNK